MLRMLSMDFSIYDLPALVAAPISITLDEGSDTFILATRKEIQWSEPIKPILSRFLNIELVYGTVLGTSRVIATSSGKRYKSPSYRSIKKQLVSCYVNKYYRRNHILKRNIKENCTCDTNVVI